MTESRVEAVARAIYAAGRGEFGIRPDHPSPRARRIFEQVWQSGGVNDDQLDDIKLCYMQAQAAIEANDAWLKAREFGIAPKIMTDEMAMHAVAAQSLSGPFNLKEMMIRGWNTAFSFAPSPEESDR